MLSYIFCAMIVLGFVCAVFTGNMSDLSQNILDSAQESVTLLISMSGMLCMWSGFMQIAKESGLMQKLSKLFRPLLKHLFKDIDENSDAYDYICMNISANLLGLGNAATPLGLNAMKEMKKKSLSDTATDDMVVFVVMNTASIQLIPTMVATLRRSYGSKSPFDTIFCVWITSVIALAVGLFVAKVFCKIGSKTPSDKQQKAEVKFVRQGKTFIRVRKKAR